jgi:hypothetical protein
VQLRVSPSGPTAKPLVFSAEIEFAGGETSFTSVEVAPPGTYSNGETVTFACSSDVNGAFLRSMVARVSSLGAVLVNGTCDAAPAGLVVIHATPLALAGIQVNE